MTTQTRTARLYVRADVSFKARIEYAAGLAHQSVSDFVRTAVESRAEELIASERVTVLGDEDFEAIMVALEGAPTTNEPLQRAARRPRSYVQA